MLVYRSMDNIPFDCWPAITAWRLVYLLVYIENKSAIFDQEAKIVFMDKRFACRHLCVCVVGYVTK